MAKIMTIWGYNLWLHLLAWLMLGLVGPSLAHAEWAEQSCSFAHRIPITITAGTAGHNTETIINLVNSDFPANYIFTPGGADVRIFESDDSTPVDFVVTGWDSITRSATIYVRLPAIAASTSETIYIYVGDDSLASADNAPGVFPNVGLRLRSRVSTADPVSATDAFTAFNAATVDVYDAVRSSVSGINNRAVGGTNGDYGWCISAVLNVTAATAGVWEFRYGADFGRGGHLYVRETALEEDWNDDLWWAGNYANTAETLSGSINLPVGWHRYEALGFEGCCDGTTGFQARPPGGPWQDLSSVNFDMRGAQCIIPSATISKAAPESCNTLLEGSKTVDIISDPMGGASPYALPGSVAAYDIEVINTGQEVDAGTIVLTDALPSEISLMTTGTGVFAFIDGPFASGLGFTYGGPTDTGDSVEFSTNGTDFTYIPSSPTDAAVTHVRFRPTGTMNPNDSGDRPSFKIRILGVID